MLYSLVLELKPDSETSLSPTQGYYGYALFLSLLQGTDPDLSAKLHDMDGAKPFTVSPLQGKFVREADHIRLTAQSRYSIRITILDEAVFATFLGALLKDASSARVRLQTGVFQVVRIATTPSASPWARCQEWRELREQAKPDRRIDLEFISPTAFRSGGKRNVLFPQPGLVFGSYLNRWNSLSPTTLSLSILDSIDSHVTIARYQLKTHILHFNGYQETGFEGTCSYLIDEATSEEDVTVLNLLADFAFYSGAGAKTTMGMGQTRRITYARSLSDRTGVHPPQRR